MDQIEFTTAGGTRYITGDFTIHTHGYNAKWRRSTSRAKG
jgi:hypothetical protein